ncbi:MAG: IS1595 family transposase [Sulfurovum sp.]|nr:MAG: IS1595 family transposase [Sulfurovum sp.]
MKVPNNRPLSDYKVKKILWHFVVDVTATQTAQLLQINRNTVNRYYNKFRQIIYCYQQERFKKVVGSVELDESYFGATRKRGFRGKLKRGRGTHKQPVFGIFLRDGEVYTEIVPDAKKATLQAIIKRRVDIQSIIYSDGWRGYDGLVDVGYDKHFRVNHGKNEFALEGEIHINGIESFWSFTKRRLKKFNGVKINFGLHLKECEFRWRKSNELMYNILKQNLKKGLC